MNALPPLQSPAVFRFLVEASVHPFYVVNPAAGFRFVYVNPAAAAFMGCECEQLLGMTVTDWEPDLDRARLDALWQDVLRDGSATCTASVRGRGGVRPVEATMHRVDVDGKALLAGSFRDVSERAAIEAQLRAVIETLPDPVWLKDPNGVYLTCNHRCERLLGAKGSDVVGKTDYDFLDREFADFVREKDRLAIELGGPSVNEEEVTYADDGHREILETIKTPMVGPKGELIGVLGIARDITRRKELEARLKEEAEIYQTAINTPAIGFWMASAEGRFLEVNDAYVAQSGYTRDELLAMAIPDVEAMEKPEETAAHIESIIRDGYARFESRHRRKDGSEWPVEVITSFSKTRGGRFFVFIEDITERKRAEAALARVNEELEARVLQRTAELVVARDEAEQASRAKSEFLSTMSHELRTPLNAILGYSQLMQLQPETSAAQRENLGEILKAGQHLLALIGQVLDLARVESGRVELDLEDVECRALLEDSLRLMRPAAGAAAITLMTEPHTLPATLWVRADPMRLRQTLLNLVSNAIKYNRPQGRVTIRLEAGAGESVRFTVADTGVGIPAARQSELFQPFNRIAARNSTIEGAGIGLFISRTLVEAMGGKIGFESHAGVGSTFWIELPRIAGK